MQQKQNCDYPLRRKGSISRVSKVTCGLLFCLTTGAFAAGENVELLTSDRECSTGSSRKDCNDYSPG